MGELMTKWNARTDAEWIAMHRTIKAGHIPLAPTADKDVYELAYWEGVYMRTLFPHMPTKGDVVLDLGCGNGRFAITCLPFGCDYIGMDPVRQSVEWCNEAFKPWADRYRFEFIDVYSRDYNAKGAIQPIDFRIPLDDESVTYACAISVFTHLCTLDVAKHYVEEMLRVLVPGGMLWTTWFKSPPNEPTGIIERTVFTEEEIRALFAGCEWVHDQDGDTTATHDQWRVWVRK